MIPPEYEKKMEHMVGEQLLREALQERYGIHLEYEARGAGSMENPLSAVVPRFTTISVTLGSMWCVSWLPRRWESTFRSTADR